ncbi:DNA primase [Pelagirhabdus alkalitolerans]|uniref:DNA primase n=1 Tax=Pelagirhabdus alkalitolerans TaxID=1612202 RepID=A0A1G6HXQ9_9BACI|nr:DNA primase [Pelagirhabdus alkalitolerans]SDB98615.1 DNA primase [Pelagirhabdus alkalitolerans]
MSGQIPEQLIEEVRQANDIVDVVGDYVSLKKQGKNYFGLCPFHGENTPSFSVTQDKQIYHCFGCGKGGNAFTFLMEIEGFTFQQAVEHLAEKSGYELPEHVKGQQNSVNHQDQDSLMAYQWLTKFYHHILEHAKESKHAKDYLYNRGLNDEMIERFQIGFSPEVQELTPQFLEKKGFNLQQMVQSGLLMRNDHNKVYDRFRGRIIFPIRNHLGKTVGFGGRALGDDEPKYLNSSESSLFQKGKMLFNFDLARSAIKKEKQAILFEGYMDVISAFQVGIENGVATLGTSITDTQASLLKRYVDTVVICYDGDHAGREASYQAAQRLKKAGCDVRIGILPTQLDPDAYIKEYGAKRFKHEVIEASSTYPAFTMFYFKGKYNLQVEADQMAYIDQITNELATVERAIDREHYARELANQFNLSIENIVEEIDKKRSQNHRYHKDRTRSESHTNHYVKKQTKNKLLPAYHNAERKLLTYMLYDRSIAEKIKHQLGANFNIDMHKVIVTHLYAFYEDGYDANVSQFIERIPDDVIKNDVIQMAMEPVLTDMTDEEIDDYIRIIKGEKEEKATIRDLVQKQKQAELNKDYVLAAQIGMEIVDLQKRLKSRSR